MNFKRLFKSTAIAGVGLAFAATASLAASATTSLNVRSGPNSSYAKVDVLFPGEHVKVKTCRTNGWCYITHKGPDGWVSSRYLTNNKKSFSHYVTPVRPHVPRVPSTGITIHLGAGGVGWSIINPAPRCIYKFGKRYCR